MEAGPGDNSTWGEEAQKEMFLPTSLRSLDASRKGVN